MRSLAYLFAALVSVLSLGSAAAQDPIVIRFSHVVSADAPKGRAALKFAELAAERTGGKVRVDVFPNSRLYGDKDEMAALFSGHVEMLAPSLSKFRVLRVTDFEVFDLPFLFSDIAAVHRVTQGEIGKAMLGKLEQSGVVGLAFWDNGFKQMSANKPLRTLKDLDGVSMRIQPSNVLDSTMKALGVRPRPLEFSEVYSSLKVGAVDGTEGPISNFYTQNLHRAQKYLTLSDHGYLGYAVITNKKFWSGLPADIRTALETALRDATVFANQAALDGNAAALEAVKASGQTEVIELTAQEKAAWRDAVESVYHSGVGGIPTDLLENVRKVAGHTLASDAR
ncbi:MAG: DctP family TRAP transporter solute-binding subunit [Azoarcus sp.]|nr:DctP family TRAP transporter solute-binding subunit [Azoarcus sp.]